MQTLQESFASSRENSSQSDPMLRENERYRTGMCILLVQRDVPEKCGGKRDKTTRHQATMLAWCLCYRVIFGGCAKEEKKASRFCSENWRVLWAGRAGLPTAFMRANASTGATMWGQSWGASSCYPGASLKLQHELRRRTTEVRSGRLTRYSNRRLSIGLYIVRQVFWQVLDEDTALHDKSHDLTHDAP